MKNQDIFYKLTEEIKTKLSEQLQSAKVKEMIEKIKTANDSGKFSVVVSTDFQDRQGEVINQDGWDLDFYKSNPVVLWAHDYCQLPIGACENIEVKEGKLVAEGKFAPAEANPFAQQVRQLYDGGFIKATSVGFIPKRMEGNIIFEAELLEFSFVPVPANPFALTLEKAGFNVAELMTKGILIKEEPKEGDKCVMDDGADGEMKPDADGNMVCVPKETTKPEPEIEGDYIIIRVKDPEYFDPESFRTIDISEEKGIKATIGCKKGEYEGGACKIGTEVQRYLFDKEKWTEADAIAWVEENKKSMEMKSDRVLSEKNHTLIDGAISQMKQSIAALEELLKATEPQGGEPGKSNDPANQRSSGAGFDIKEALNQYLLMKQVLRSVSTAIGDALGKVNKKSIKK